MSGTGAGTRAAVVSGGGIAAGGDGTAAVGTGFSFSPPRGRIQRMIAPAAASPISTGRSRRAAPRVAAASCAAVPGRVSVCTGTVPPLGVVSMSSESMTSPAVCGRSAGALLQAAHHQRREQMRHAGPPCGHRLRQRRHVRAEHRLRACAR